MNKVSKSIINQLAEQRGTAQLTMYMPTHKESSLQAVSEDQARFKNLLRRGLEEWEQQVNPQKIAAIRKQLEEKNEDRAFWNDTSRSLAVFASKQQVHFYHLPIESDEYIYVGDTFDVAPLQIVDELNQPYYLFTLALHNSKLFYGDMYGLAPVTINFPASPEDALNIDEMFSGSNTIRGISVPGKGNEKFSSHGQGDSNHAGQEERLKYFRILDDTIARSPAVDSQFPILLAATDSEASDYKAISKLSHLLPVHIQGNYTQTPLPELHKLSWATILQEVVQKKLAQHAEKFHELKGLKQASSDMTEIKEAAAMGRVDTLLVGIVPETNDSVSETADGPLIRLQGEYRDGLRDAVQVVSSQGGAVLGVDASLIGTPSLAAAIYRY
ncbi:MAG TPA: hypothetical protein VD907_02925 [Verrucomicrobiae bacterium]|nr:hypothetical protein [Verrucomicrobiae bacterium]